MRQNEVKMPFLTKNRTPSPFGFQKTSKSVITKVLQAAIGLELGKNDQARVFPLDHRAKLNIEQRIAIIESSASMMQAMFTIIL